MDAFKLKFILLLIACIMLLGGGIGVMFYYLFPSLYPHWYLGILSFFLFVELGIISWVDAKSHKLEQRAMVNMYLSLKIGKILLSLLFILVYAMVEKEGIKSFALTFVIFYFCFILFDTYLLSAVERRLKEKK